MEVETCGVVCMTDSLDKIHIRDLLVRCIIGIYPEERENPQDVYINVTLHANFEQACHSDGIDDTVNYKSIKKKIFEFVENSSYNLIEKLAEEIAQICLEDQRVARADVMVDKPGALRFARSVAVEITRSRTDAVPS